MKRYTTIRRVGTCLSLSVWLGLTACSEEKYLQTVPPTSIGSEDVFSTPDRVLGLVNGSYDALKSSDFYGGRFLIYTDVRGEDFVNVTGNTFTAYESWTNAYASGSNDVNTLWAAAYRVINRSNILIDGLQKYPGKVTEALSKQYTGEAKLLRALSYFSLVTLYARPYVENQGATPGLPLRLQGETTPANNDLARSSVAEVYAQILKDLNEAEAALPESYTTPLLNTTRAHKNTAIALKTRVYLNMANYAKVVEEAKKIVPQTTAPFTATTGVKHALQNIVTIFTENYTSTESILSMPMTELDTYTGQSSIGYIYNTNSEYYVNPRGILGDPQWATGDARRNFLRTASNQQYFKKYAKPSPFLDYIPVMRYAEVLLNYAEAAAKTGNLTLATNLLKAVHGRSDASYVFPESAVSTEAALVSTIWKERRIELLGEGFRSNDLLRNLQTIPGKSGGSLIANPVAPSAANYIFPLPNTEISTNKLLLQ